MVKNPGVIEYIDTDETVNAMIAMYESDVNNMRERELNSVELVSKITLEPNATVINRYDDLMFLRYTHCEIHPSFLLGIVASSIPFCNHNQGPRNIYQYSQAQQAMGIYTSNYRDRLDISYILYHAQRPLVTTRAMKYTNTDKLPYGENVIVAIMCYTGLLISSCHDKNHGKSVYDRRHFQIAGRS
jgi:DNA-directed RNA polymerase II subunit RPB2